MATPKQRSLNIQRATKKARKNFDKWTEQQLTDIYLIFDQSADEIAKRINAQVKEGKIPPARLGKLYTDVTTEIRTLRTKLNSKMLTGVNQSIDLGIESQIRILDGNVPGKKVQVGTSFFDKNGNIRKYNPVIQTAQESQWAKLHANALKAYIKFSPTGQTLSSKVWDLTYNAEKAIRSAVTRGVILGDSPQKLSRDIRQFLIEPDKRFRRIRKGTKLVPSQAMKEYTPGRGIYKSAYKNALRTARTEYARAYNEGTVQYSMSKKWIKGWISRVQSTNPAPYDLSVNGKFFKKKEGIDIPYHPNCLCYAEIVTDETPSDKLKPAQSRIEFNKEQLKLEREKKRSKKKKSDKKAA